LKPYLVLVISIWSFITLPRQVSDIYRWPYTWTSPMYHHHQNVSYPISSPIRLQRERETNGDRIKLIEIVFIRRKRGLENGPFVASKQRKVNVGRPVSLYFRRIARTSDASDILNTIVDCGQLMKNHLTRVDGVCGWVGYPKTSFPHWL